MIKIACIGNISRDYALTTGLHAYTSLGGNALFTALSSVSLGVTTTVFGNMGHEDMEVYKTEGLSDLISNKYEPIFPNSFNELYIFSKEHNGQLHLEGINHIDGLGNVVFIKSKTDYSSSSDTYIYSLAPRLDEYFVINNMHILAEFDAILLCPVNGEVSGKLVKVIRECCKNSFLTIDMQGTVRQVGIDRKEYSTFVPEIQDYISNVDFIKLNDIEAQYAFGIKIPIPVTRSNWHTILRYPIEQILHYTKTCNPDLIFMITFGAEGLIIITDSRKIIFIKALPSTVIDHLGAGDAAHAAFVKCFLLAKNIQGDCYAATERIICAGIASSVSGSLVVQGMGALGCLSLENFDQAMSRLDIQNQVLSYDISSL